MTRSRQDTSPQPYALRRAISHEQARSIAPGARPSSSQHETQHAAAMSDPTLEVGWTGDTFGSEEPPTIALSQPILRLLASESAGDEDGARPTRPAPAPEPTRNPEASPFRASANPAADELETTVANPAADELETTAPPAELSSPALPLREPSTVAGKRAVLLAAACLLAGALVGARAWMRNHGDSWLASRAPSATIPADLSPPHAVRSAHSRPAVAAAQKPGNASPLAAGAATKTTVLRSDPAPLVAVDGSERRAPSCDALLADVPGEGEKAFDHVRAARQALVRGDADAAQRGLCRAIRAGQADASVAIELAQVLILRRDASAAVPWALEARRINPTSALALNLLGDALVRTGNLDEARSLWLKASKLSEGDRAGIARQARAALAPADNALRERDPARAERLLRRVIAFQPENGAAHSKLAVALTRLGFTESAEAWTKRAAEFGPAQ